MALGIRNGWYSNPDEFWANVDVRGPDECWPWKRSGDKDGYGHLAVRQEDGSRKWRKAHDVAWELANGRRLRHGMVALHRCDNPPCCNPRDLYEGTHGDNMRDMKIKRRAAIGRRNGTHTRPNSRATGSRNGARTHPEKLARGEDHPQSKLTEEVALKIYRAVSNKQLSQRAAARQFGINQSTISRLMDGRIWSQVTGVQPKIT